MKHECAALHCEKVIDSRHLMCRGHWWHVPPKLRNTINRLVSASDSHAERFVAIQSMVYQVAVVLAVRAVATDEGHAIIGLPERGLHGWRLVRKDLRDELGVGYDAALQPYRARLTKLMDKCAGEDPIEVAAIAMRLEPAEDVDEEKNKRRIAAAIDLSEGRS